MLLPMYHFDKCGFKFDVATADGGAVAIEEWTFGMATGYEDKLKEMQTKLKDQLEKPMKFVDVPVDLEPYAAVFLPGGHGPLIEQHTHESLGTLLRSANAKALPTIAICHGQSALRAAALGGEFPYKDYKIVVFPDSVDKKSPKFGYLPGYLGEDKLCEAKLKALGCNVQNEAMDDSTCVDRELITGCSQLASQNLSVVAAQVLAEKCGFKVRTGPEAVVAVRCSRR
jgi:molecular chaperone Hsp31 and glyoxalase 3